MPAVTGPERTPEEKLVFWGSILAGLSLFAPVLAIPGLIVGALAAAKNRVGPGIAIMAASLILSIVGVNLWLNMVINDSEPDAAPAFQLAPTNDGTDTDQDGMPDDIDSRPNDPKYY